MKGYGARRFSPLPVLLLAALAVVAFTAYFGTEDAGSQTGGSPSRATAPADEPVARVASKVGPSAVQINVTGTRQTPFGMQESEGVGSGVIYRKDGYIVTNNHVVEGASEVNIAFADGSTERGEVVGTDPATDLAVVKVNRDGLPAASFSENDDLVPGQLAVAIGSPSGFQSTITSGIISGLGREFPAEYTGGQQVSSLVDLIQTDAAISPGNSGGALADRDGRVIGINVAYLPPSETGAVNLGFAIPSDTVVSVADQIIDTGEAVHPYLGISLSDLTPETSRRFGSSVESGAIVRSVKSGSPASDAGIRTGDVVIALGSEGIQSSGDLLSALRRYQPGDRVEMTVVRDGEELQLRVRLGERGS